MIIDVAELKKQIVSVRSIAEIPTTLRTKLIETGLARAVADQHHTLPHGPDRFQSV